MRVKRLNRAPFLAVAGVVLLGLLVGCGGSGSSSASDSAPVSASSTSACADVTALKASLDALTKVRPVQDGAAALQAAIANVKTSLDTAVASASATLQPQVEQVKTAFAELQTAATGLSTDNLTQKAPEITAALTKLGTATAALGSTLTQSCPGS
jgi:hypothetical protein